MTDHTHTKKIDGDFINFYGHPSRAGNRYDTIFSEDCFGGEFMVFVGLEECIKLMSNFKLIEEDIYFICKSLPG